MRSLALTGSTARTLPRRLLGANITAQALRFRPPGGGPTRRPFSSLPTLRPTLGTGSHGSVFGRETGRTAPAVTTGGGSSGSSAEPGADLVAKSAITRHPALGGCQQIRCGPRPTLATTSRRVRKRRHGFLARLRTRNGRKILQRRRAKGRHFLSN